MRIHVPAMLAAAVLAGGAAMADGRYDRKLDEAAAQIAAAKMGSLRGGFAPDERPLLLKPVPRPQRERAERPAAPAPGEWRDGLAIAVERKSAVSPEL
ncbi:MAG: hypothetical protein M9945_07210 [Aquamicrobium sp.]|uniref:hypothetical protein n=1 Tax=Aquamicrobium sp. TaxID=1872579 RepID=UPI00349E7E60|nr:hypothetical protein [Aquamicrobium sp.]